MYYGLFCFNFVCSCGNLGAMYIEAIPNRNSPPAVLLREAYREDGKVKKRTLANISCLPTEVIEGLRVLLKGGVAVPSAEEVFTVERSLPHGHVAAIRRSIQRPRSSSPLGPPRFRKKPSSCSGSTCRVPSNTSAENQQPHEKQRILQAIGSKFGLVPGTRRILIPQDGHVGVR
jgi:hypothetical protein